MEKIIASAILFFIGFATLYLLGSFYFVSFDIGQWSEHGRFAFVMFSFVVFYLASAPFLLG